MRPSKESGKILDDYVALARTMGKLPTVKEAVRHVASERQLYKHFESFENLKVLALKQLPELIGEDKSKAKVLIFDIETAPIIAHVWDIWDQNIGLNQIVSEWHVLSWSAKWLGDPEDKIMYMDQRNAKDIQDDKKLLEGIWKLLDEADVVITQNGIKFDVPKLNSRFMMQGLNPPSSFKHIDVYREGKKYFAFISHKLEYMTDKLCVTYKKLKHKEFAGHAMWTECLKNNLDAWKAMEKYNKYDVLSLEELYLKMAPWINKVDFNVYHNNLENVCSCGSKEFKKSNKFYFTNTAKYQRFICVKCGKESRGNVNLLSKQKKAALKKSTAR